MKTNHFSKRNNAFTETPSVLVKNFGNNGFKKIPANEINLIKISKSSSSPEQRSKYDHLMQKKYKKEKIDENRFDPSHQDREIPFQKLIHSFSNSPVKF